MQTGLLFSMCLVVVSKGESRLALWLQGGQDTFLRPRPCNGGFATHSCEQDQKVTNL